MKKIYSEVDPYGRRDGLRKLPSRPAPRRQSTPKAAVQAALREASR